MKASGQWKVFVTHQGKETQARLEYSYTADNITLSPLSAAFAVRLPRKSLAYQTTFFLLVTSITAFSAQGRKILDYGRWSCLDWLPYSTQAKSEQVLSIYQALLPPKELLSWWTQWHAPVKTWNSTQYLTCRKNTAT